MQLILWKGNNRKQRKQMLEYPIHDTVRKYESTLFMELDMLHYIPKRQEPLTEVESQPMQINVATWQWHERKLIISFQLTQLFLNHEFYHVT